MKKRVAITTIAVTAMLVLALAGTALAGKGAVKADLIIVTDPDNGLFEVVGSVSMKTTARGYLDVLISVENLPNLSNWDARVVFNPPDQDYYPSQVYQDVLDTNRNGKGKLRLSVPIPDVVLSEAVNGQFYVSVEIDETLPPGRYHSRWALVSLR